MNASEGGKPGCAAKSAGYAGGIICLPPQMREPKPGKTFYIQELLPGIYNPFLGFVRITSQSWDALQNWQASDK